MLCLLLMPRVMPSQSPIEIQDPGCFIVSGGEVPIHSLRVLRNQQGEPDELIFVMDGKLRPLLRKEKKIQLSLKGSGQQIEIDSVGAPCSDQEPAKTGLRHLHVTMLPLGLIEMINRLIETM
jgi:hypothetical protein